MLIASLRWRGALNRIYYAVFYAARALLATRDLDSSRHSGVIALFQQQFVRTSVISANVARTLPRLFEARQTSDYADGADPADDDVRAFRTDADAFITACARVLDDVAADPPGQV